jgi:hypothetical protein
VYQRNIAGESALKFFKGMVQVKSTTLLTSGHWRNYKDQDVINFYREGWIEEGGVTQVFEDAARTGLGNCFEKAAICFSSLASNPRILYNSFIIICGLANQNHSIVLVTEHDISNKHSFYLRDLSKATMIVDGWTEDYYFPNLSAFERYRFNVGKSPNPVQLFTRWEVNRDRLERLERLEVVI